MAAGKQAGRPGAKRDKVLASVKLLREIYTEGLGIHRLLAKPAKPGETKIGRVEKEAAKRGMNRDYLWKSQMLADPATGISGEELEQLCKWTTRYRRIVGRGWIAKLVSVPPKKRMAFAEMVLKQGLSLSEMDTELSRRFGRRRQGGRHPRIVASKKAILVGLDTKCVSWHRLYEFLDKPAGAGASRRVGLADLPEEVQEGIGAVDRAVRKLRKAVQHHLGPVPGKGKKTPNTKG